MYTLKIRWQPGGTNSEIYALTRTGERFDVEGVDKDNMYIRFNESAEISGRGGRRHVWTKTVRGLIDYEIIRSEDKKE